MTISDLHCDACGAFVSQPSSGPDSQGGGVRFVYHPGRPQLRDTSGLMCGPCWEEVLQWLGASRNLRECAVCQEPVSRQASLHLGRFEGATSRLCRQHAVEFLNRLRTVEPKLDLADFQFPFADATDEQDAEDEGAQEEAVEEQRA